MYIHSQYNHAVKNVTKAIVARDLNELLKHMIAQCGYLCLLRLMGGALECFLFY